MRPRYLGSEGHFTLGLNLGQREGKPSALFTENFHVIFKTRQSPEAILGVFPSLVSYNPRRHLDPSPSRPIPLPRTV